MRPSHWLRQRRRRLARLTLRGGVFILNRLTWGSRGEAWVATGVIRHQHAPKGRGGHWDTGLEVWAPGMTLVQALRIFGHFARQEIGDWT